MRKKLELSEFIMALSFLAIMILVCHFAVNGISNNSYAYVVQADATNTDAQGMSEEPTTEESTTEESVTPEGGNSSSTSTGNEVSQAEIAALTAEYTNTLKEKNELQTTLNSMMETQNDFITRLNELDDMIIEYQTKLDDIEEKTTRAYAMMGELTDDIDTAQAAQDAQYELLKKHIREEYENGTYSYLEAFFNAVDYTDVVNKAEYIQAIEKYDEVILAQYRDAKLVLANKKLMLETLNDDMSVLAEAYQNKQDSIEIISAEKEAQVNSYQASIDSMNSKIKSLEAIETEMTAKIAAAEASFNVSYSNGSSGTTYSGEQFLWPMPASKTISSYYGPRTAPTAGATSYHRGIDIPCPIGSEVIAAAAGTVIYVGYLGNGGNCVIVDHGSGISTCYFHLSDFGCSVGDKVTAGQTICYSGNTGISTGPHLHFAVRENGEYVNPLNYFKMIEDKSQVSNTEGNTTDTSSSSSTEASTEATTEASTEATTEASGSGETTD